jgi:PKD repeat protein
VPGEPPVAIIVAKPVKGYSPLKVHFSASRSRAVKGKILSYEWDFGDGDTSKKPSCVNTFYSGSFEPKKFTVTLTIQDDRGNVGTTSTEVEVLNK